MLEGEKMSRTKGATDKKKRKQRKFYAGKPIKKKRRKHGKFVPYISKRQRGDPIKAWIWEVRKMSKTGYRNFSAKTRPFMKKIVFVPLIRIDVDPERLSSVEAIKELFLEVVGYEGSFLLKLFCHAKNRMHVTNRTVAKVKITSHPEGLKAQVFETFRISRYFFWIGR